MILLDDRTGVAETYCFKEEESRLNNGILSEENENWVVPTVVHEFKKIYLSNATARNFINNIEILFDNVL